MLLKIPKTDCSARKLEDNNGFDPNGTRRLSTMDSEASYALWFCIACAFSSHSRKAKSAAPNKTCERLVHTVSMQSQSDAMSQLLQKSLKCNFHTFFHRCPQSSCSVSSPVEPLAVLHCVAAKPCCQKAWQIVKGGPEVPSEECECMESMESMEHCQQRECELSIAVLGPPLSIQAGKFGGFSNLAAQIQWLVLPNRVFLCNHLHCPCNLLSVEVLTATLGRPKVPDFRFVLDPYQSFLTTEEAFQDQAH